MEDLTDLRHLLMTVVRVGSSLDKGSKNTCLVKRQHSFLDLADVIEVVYHVHVSKKSTICSVSTVDLDKSMLYRVC